MRVLLSLLLLFPGLSQAQVYKCTGKSGETVYSQNPCRSDAQPHVLRSGQLAGSDMRVDAQCLEQARAAIYGAANDRAASHNQRLAERRAAGATASELAQIERERRSAYADANAQVQQARRQCLRPPQDVPQAEDGTPPAMSGTQSDT